MLDPAYGDGVGWLLTAVLGVGVFAIRLSFIQLRGRFTTFPPAVEDALAYVPPAVIAALIFPALFVLDGTVGGLLNARVLAAGLATVVAWRTKSVLATIVVGMAVLWATAYVLG